MITSYDDGNGCLLLILSFACLLLSPQNQVILVFGKILSFAFI